MKALLRQVLVSLFALSPIFAAEPCKDPALRDEILAMAQEDQADRPQPGQGQTEAETTAMLKVDAKHATRMREIVTQVGWPGKSLVGKDAAHRAWLLVQHFDIEDQDHYLPLLREAVAAGEAEGRDLAYLEDRVRGRHGLKQLYGTQYHSDPAKPDKWIRDPIEDPDHLDERRKAVGLPPLLEFEKNIPNEIGRAHV